MQSTKAKIITIVVLVIGFVMIGFGSVFGAPEGSQPETTVEEVETTQPETTVEEVCVPEGIPVTDVETGETYLYNVPGLHGYDSCAYFDEELGEVVGEQIPNICIQWGDGHYSRLWTAELCGPDTPVTETTEVAAIIPVVTESVTPGPAPENQGALPTDTLPETGGETILFAIVALLLLSGGISAVRFSRKGIQ